ncbi:MAG: sensor histidine kinase [Alphaproteobacteria bacterium]|nr:sensor histidine kinase [Alphaproteobacteria bacterium]
MRGYWGQPSLSRDFALLSAAVFFLLSLISAWVIYSTYEKNSERIKNELEKEAARVERTLAGEMEAASHMLVALGKQFALDPTHDLTKMAQTLKSFDSKGYIYAVFTVVNPEEKIVVSSAQGVLDVPVDASDRDYVKSAVTDPWKMQIGRPVEGHVSNRWVIPVAMGISDSTGKFIGTIVISIDISTLTERISNLVRRDGMSFAIISKTLIALTQVSEDPDFLTNNFPAQKLQNVDFVSRPSGLLTLGSLFWGTGKYSYYRISADYPYIILLGYDPHYSDVTVRTVLFSRLAQMMLIAVFFVLFLWIMRLKMIRPVLEMTTITAQIAKGNTKIAFPKAGAVEIEGLATQIRRIGEYIDETHRVEDELQNKILMLRRARIDADISNRSKSELLGCICQELLARLNRLINAAQGLKEQRFGSLPNEDYKRTANEIYSIGTVLFEELRDTLALSKVETAYLKITEQPVDISMVASKTLRFLADKMQTQKLGVKVVLHDPMPYLMGDEQRLQQIFMNLMLYLFEFAKPESTLLIEGRVVNEQKERHCLTLVFTTDEESPYTPADLLQLANRTIQSGSQPDGTKSVPAQDEINIGLELAKSLVAAHRGFFNLQQQPARTTITLLFNGSRIRFMDVPES